MDGYEAREARRRLLAARGRSPAVATQRSDACRTLLSEFIALAKGLEIHVEARPFVKGSPASMRVGLPRCGIALVYEKDGFLFARLEPAAGSTKPLADVELKLDFDPSSGRFVGREPDDSVAPIPGEPWAKRGALDVIAFTVIELLENEHSLNVVRRRGTSSLET